LWHDSSVDIASLTGRYAERDTWSADRCPVDRSLAVVGTRSAILLMREAHYGTRRFDQFAQRVGVSEPVAAARLRDLVEEGLLVRVPYQEPGRRTRYEYELTEKGRDFATVLIALGQWGTRWQSPEGPPIELRHAGCGRSVSAEIRCADGHEVELGDLELRPGPGSALDEGPAAVG
jgi:DNA-binding HxlR family transcriptional regulator